MRLRNSKAASSASSSPSAAAWALLLTLTALFGTQPVTPSAVVTESQGCCRLSSVSPTTVSSVPAEISPSRCPSGDLTEGQNLPTATRSRIGVSTTAVAGGELAAVAKAGSALAAVEVLEGWRGVEGGVASGLSAGGAELVGVAVAVVGVPGGVLSSPSAQHAEAQ